MRRFRQVESVSPQQLMQVSMFELQEPSRSRKTLDSNERAPLRLYPEYLFLEAALGAHQPLRRDSLHASMFRLTVGNMHERAYVRGTSCRVSLRAEAGEGVTQQRISFPPLTASPT